MDHSLKRKVKNRKNRALRVRKRLRGTAERPRLCISKTNRHLSVQVIDDDRGVTLVSASTLNRQFAKEGKNKTSAQALGKHLAELCKGLNIESGIVDRGHCRYHGLLAELADAARDAGLKL